MKLYQEELWNKYLESNDYKCTNKCNSDNACPYVLVIEFSKNKILDKNINMTELSIIINNEFNSEGASLECMISNDNTLNDRLLLRLRLMEGDEEDDD